jgi:predicted dehydrogenase
LYAITSAKGLSARHLAERYDIGLVLPTAAEVLALDEIDIVFILSRHESHADLVIKALDAGKHVYVEKPLAITSDQLDQVEAAYERNDSTLFVGFNRRYSDATLRAKQVFEGGYGPLAINYRINAGQLPDSHWYKDRRQGGRIVGEVCHFIDLASWIIGEGPTTVNAVGSGRGEAALEEDVSILLGYPDGSAATITYTTGANPITAKERLEILGRGHTVLIEDFRSMIADGRHRKDVHPGKGHSEALETFRRAITQDPPSMEHAYVSSIQSMRVSFAVLRILAEGSCDYVGNNITKEIGG